MKNPSCVTCADLGCPLQPSNVQCEVSGKFVVLRWEKASVLAGDPPITLYIVQAKELFPGMSLRPPVHFIMCICIVLYNGFLTWSK